MSLWRRLVGRSGGRVDTVLLSRRAARFRQLLRSYSGFLDLLEDAAEKQGGDFILDRQYVVALTDKLVEIADGAVFDLNVLTGERDLEVYATLEELGGRLRGILSDGFADEPESADAASVLAQPGDAEAVGSPALAAALSRHPVALRHAGHVACRGVGAGAVAHLEKVGNLGDGAAGRVLVATNLVPDDTTVATLRGAAAILLAEGSPTSPAASLARELRIPTIVGLRGFTGSLTDGEAVTVDADENTIYRGIVRELIDYYAAERIGSEEEPEYHLLRRVRRAVFPLTLPPDSAPELGRCTTLHDVVFLAHARGGGAVVAALAEQARRLPSATGSTGDSLRIIDLVEGESGTASTPVAGDAGASRSRPLSAFLAGQRCPGAFPDRSSTMATVKEEQALIVLFRPVGYDLVDAVSCDSPALNHVYCRFEPRLDADDVACRRGELAAGVLERLGFAARSAGGQVSGWLRGLPPTDTEQRLRMLGSLAARLDDWSKRELGETALATAAAALAAECGQVDT